MELNNETGLISWPDKKRQKRNINGFFKSGSGFPGDRIKLNNAYNMCINIPLIF
jgi:hypothetical protein